MRRMREDFYRDRRRRDMEEDFYEDERDYARRRKMRDRHTGARIDPEMLEMWSMDLYDNLDDNMRNQFKFENVIKRAEEMGITFDRYSIYEFYPMVIVHYNLYHKTLNNNNVELYVKMSKDWFCDKNSKVKYSKKLHEYFDIFVDDDF